MIGFGMHNTSYKVTVQWQYTVYMKGPRGPFQTSITINVQNLVVNSSDETKVLKWDPVRGIADTNFSYSLECAQRKECGVCITIYSTDGMKVYEEWLEQIAPGSYDFVWDGTMNTGYYEEPPGGEEPSNIAPAGLYVFDIEVIGIAPGYDEDCLRSKALRIVEHEVGFINGRLAEARYILRSNRPATKAWIEVYDPLLNLIAGPVQGQTKAIPDNAIPQESDWIVSLIPVQMTLHSIEEYPYRFLFWAQDSFFDFYKSHRNKIAFVNQTPKHLGWILSFGQIFNAKNFRYHTLWGMGGLRTLNTTGEATTAADAVATLLPPGKRTEVPGYAHRFRLRNGETVSTLITQNISSERAAQWISWCVTNLPGWGLIHYGGHGGWGCAIGFVDPRYSEENADKTKSYWFLLGNKTRVSNIPPRPGWFLPFGPEAECIDVFQIVRLFYDRNGNVIGRDPLPLRFVKVVGIFACKVSDNGSDDLIASFAKLGAHAVVGPKFSPSAIVGTPLNKASEAFWKVLAGKRKPHKKYKKPSVEAATQAAADAIDKELEDFGITGAGKFYPNMPIPEDVVIYK